MKITVENTSKIVMLNGVLARIWEGETSSGIRVQAFITRIAVAEGANDAEFQQELQQQRVPSVEAESFPLRMIL
jgi:hypothetical protein